MRICFMIYVYPQYYMKYIRFSPLRKYRLLFLVILLVDTHIAEDKTNECKLQMFFFSRQVPVTVAQNVTLKVVTA